MGTECLYNSWLDYPSDSFTTFTWTVGVPGQEGYELSEEAPQTRFDLIRNVD